MARRAVSYKKIRDEMNDLAEKACDEWEQCVAEEPDGRCLLYFRNPNNRQRVGRMKVSARDPKRGWKLAANMRMPGRWSRDEAKAYIRNRMAKLPILRGPFKS